MDKKLEMGAVWLGPWGTHLIERTFGTATQLHFAMTNGKITKEKIYSTIQFFPFTSKKNNKALLTLPPGTVSWGQKNKWSYLLNFKLLTTVEDLEIRFKYKKNLPQDICEEFRKNYAQLIKNRKIKK